MPQGTPGAFAIRSAGEKSMALVIHIKKGQKVIINGAVMENVTGKTISLLLKNEASVLRSEDVLSPEDASTPASRVYYALQCVYLFPERREQHLRDFNQLLDSYLRAAPSSSSIAKAVRSSVDEEQFYAALKRAQELIKHEGKVLSHVEKQLAENLRGTPETRQSEADGGVGLDPGCIAFEGEPGHG
jgi:flagellar protein FlbT